VKEIERRLPDVERQADGKPTSPHSIYFSLNRAQVGGEIFKLD
jgi:hypothetical protein